MQATQVALGSRGALWRCHTTLCVKAGAQPLAQTLPGKATRPDYRAKPLAGAPLPPNPRALRVPLRPARRVLGVTACGMTAAGLSRDDCYGVMFSLAMPLIGIPLPLVERCQSMAVRGSLCCCSLSAARRFQWPLPLRRAIALTRVRFNVAPWFVFLTAFF